jgi:transposase
MPGAGKQPPEVQEQIKELLEAGFDPTTIHRRLKVGRSSIYRMKRSLEQHGTNYMPKELNKKNGRPKVLTPAQELVSCCNGSSILESRIYLSYCSNLTFMMLPCHSLYIDSLTLIKH